MKKVDRSGLFINILILIIAILIAVLFFMYTFMDDNELAGGFVTSDANIVISSISGEKTEEIENRTSYDENQHNALEIPILDETVNANARYNAAANLSNCYKYYYYQLDDNAKEIYNAIERNIDNIKDGTFIIQLSDDIGKVLDQENGEAILNEEFQSAWDAIIMDRVELFYIDVSKVSLEMRTTSYGKLKTHRLTMKPNAENYLEDDFYNKEVVNTVISQVESVKDQIIENLSGSEYEKIIQVNDWLVENIDYGTIYGNNAYNIYGALLGKNCVCEGYAESFKYIMDALEIPCILVIGTAHNSEGNSENHEWNYVQLNGTWYAMDVTWNDPIINGRGKLNNSLKHQYLLTGNRINENHNPNGKISINGITFTYPELGNNDYK